MSDLNVTDRMVYALASCKRRKDAVILYEMALGSEDVMWQVINTIIINRWSVAGLQYIKTEAWKLRNQRSKRVVRNSEFINQQFEAGPKARDEREYTVLPDVDKDGNPYRILVCGSCHRKIPRSGSIPNFTCGQCGRMYVWGEPTQGMTFPRA